MRVSLVWVLWRVSLLGPRQAKKCFRACAKCADSHHPAHYPKIMAVDSEVDCASWTFAVRTCPEVSNYVNSLHEKKHLQCSSIFSVIISPRRQILPNERGVRMVVGTSKDS